MGDRHTTVRIHELIKAGLPEYSDNPVLTSILRLLPRAPYYKLYGARKRAAVTLSRLALAGQHFPPPEEPDDDT